MRLARQRQLAILSDIAHWLQQDIALPQALRQLAVEAQRYRLTREAQLLRCFTDNLHAGRPLSSDCQAWLDDDLRYLCGLAAGSRQFAEQLLKFAQLQQHRSRILNHLWRPLAYPLVLLLMSFAALHVIASRVLTPLQLEQGANALPLSMQSLLWLADTQRRYALLLIIVSAAVIAGYRRAAPSMIGDWRLRCQRFGAFCLQRQLAAVELLYLLALQAQQGMSLLRAVTLMRAQANRYSRWQLDYIAEQLNKGQSQVAQLFRPQFLPARLHFRLVAGWRRRDDKRAASVLMHAADYAMQDAANFATRLSWLLQLICYACVALLMGMLISAVMQVMTLSSASVS